MEAKDHDKQRRNRPRSSGSGGAGNDNKKRKRARSRGKSSDMNHSKQRSHKDANDSFSGFVGTPEPQKKKPSRQSQNNGERRQNGASNGHQGHRRRRKPHRKNPYEGGQDPQQVVSSQIAQNHLANASIASELLNVESAGKQTLQWQTIHPPVPIQSEERIVKTLIRWKEKERGMMRNAGDRYKEVARKCKQVGMHLSQALSLRRQHMHHLNPNLRMTALGLGKDEDIRQSAALFESAVESYMNQCSISFLTEAQQKAALPQGTKSPPTPDFMLLEPTLLSTMTPLHHGQTPTVNEFVVHWVEAKMFYGASSIANDSESAVGRILATSEKYVNLYGTGAMVFMYGCGKELAEWLLQRGVVALDAHPLDLRRVKQHQRTWCANKSGMILP